MKAPGVKRLVAGVVFCLVATSCKKAETPLSWNTKTLVTAYHHAGHSNAKWDEPAQGALLEFARIRVSRPKAVGDSGLIISNYCRTAMDAGCFDPMIRYLSARFGADPARTRQETADLYCKVAEDMENSSYPSIRKYYAWYWAAQAVTSAYGYGTNIPAQVNQLDIWTHAENDLLSALPDRGMPPVEASDASLTLLALWAGSPKDYAALYEKILKQIPSDRLNTPSIYLLKGEADIAMAWHARGGGYANTVSDEAYKLFLQRLAEAENALTNAWHLDTNDARIPVKMMTVVLGEQKDRKNLELWFQRAMQIDPNNYDACDSKLNYLEPKWYGSVADMLAFGRECVQNQDWGGHVPLILMDAHRSIVRQYVDESEKATYWARPDVWQDINAAFERFFALNPDETGWFHNYAWYAYQAGQWDTFNSLVPKLGLVNYQYFGGRDAFERMVATSKQKANAGKTNN